MVVFVLLTSILTLMDEVKEELKSAIIMNGGQCVMMVGAATMPL